MFTPNNQQQQGQQQQVQTNKPGQSSNANVTKAQDALNTMKHEIAGELGINLKKGYNGDLTSREAGYIGGYMVKRMIEQQEQSMSQKS